MKVRLIQTVEGRMIKTEFDALYILDNMEIRGYHFSRLNNNPRQRAELQGQPVFSGLVGPMWDGDAIRYEDRASNDSLSY